MEGVYKQLVLRDTWRERKREREKENEVALRAAGVKEEAASLRALGLKGRDPWKSLCSWNGHTKKSGEDL